MIVPALCVCTSIIADISGGRGAHDGLLVPHRQTGVREQPRPRLAVRLPRTNEGRADWCKMVLAAHEQLSQVVRLFGGRTKHTKDTP